MSNIPAKGTSPSRLVCGSTLRLLLEGSMSLVSAY